MMTGVHCDEAPDTPNIADMEIDRFTDGVDLA